MGLGIRSRPRGLKGKDLGSVLLKPTRIYVKPVLKLLKGPGAISGMSHITGGGFAENIARVMPKGVKAVINRGSWPVDAIFRLIQSNGRINEAEMLRTFNCGIGFVIMVRPALAASVLRKLKALRVRAYEIGGVEALKGRQPTVEFTGPAQVF
jgi:phosphoribosylformylglycinamidine cyclo-ligase